MRGCPCRPRIACSGNGPNGADALAALRPILRRDPEATVTAGNSSGQNDAAAACIVTTPARAAELGLVPIPRLVSWAVAGDDPLRFGVAPVPAANLAIRRAGIRFDHLDVIELNEAFAVQVLATLAHELPALDGSLALETMCIGGGQAIAAVFERV
ncbi:hypothetical protein [Agromyces allii]|uniref:acetyl-CoA C-acetyltransferase n=1 Tax=Agromyces allii TaxID=393607 RepID=A0ABN2QK22_9MICO|nr:hypothetical protein [Agromyces allii]